MKHFAFLYFLFCSYSSLLGQVLDSTFGIPTSFDGFNHIPGTTACDFGGRKDQAIATLHLDDDKIILAGYTIGADGTDFALARLLPDGQYDQSAGPDGQIRIDWGYSNDSCLAAIRYGADKILMGGCVSLPGQTKYVNLLTRVDFNGQLDSSFGAYGKIIIDLPPEYEMITKILVQSDGKIIIAGNVLYDNFFYPDSTEIFLGRLFPDGQIDSTFGTNGFLYRRYEQDCRSALLGDAVVGNNDCIIVSGGGYDPFPGDYTGGFCYHTIYIFRLLYNGQPDLGFGLNGTAKFPNTNGRANALYVEDDGKILVAGVVGTGANDPYDTFVGRLLESGSPDSTFATNGRFRKFILGNGAGSEPFDIVKLCDKIIIGFLDDPNGYHIGFGLICLSENGQLYPSFGINGMFRSYDIFPWVSYFTNNLSTIDSQGIFLGGYYNLLGQQNMYICKVRFDCQVNTTSVLSQQFINTYPNPVTNDFFYLDIPANIRAAQQMHLTINDISGQIVAQQHVDVSEPINVSSLHNGLYFFILEDGQQQFLGKLVVQR